MTRKNTNADRFAHEICQATAGYVTRKGVDTVVVWMSMSKRRFKTVEAIAGEYDGEVVSHRPQSVEVSFDD